MEIGAPRGFGWLSGLRAATVRLWTRDLGTAAARDVAGATRLLLAIVSLDFPFRFGAGNAIWSNPEQIALAGYMLIAAGTLFGRFISWKLDVRLRPIAWSADQLICLLMLLAYPQAIGLYLPFVIFALGVSLSRSPVVLVALDYLLFAAVILFHNRLADALPGVGAASDEALRLQFTLVTLVGAAILAFRASQAGAAVGDRWNEELLGTSIQARTLPIAGMATKLSERFGVSEMLICWRRAVDRIPECYRFSDGELSNVELDPALLERMLAPDRSGEGFIRDSDSGSALVDAKLRLGPTVRMIPAGFLPGPEAAASGIVAALPIRTGAFTGYIYLLDFPRISELRLSQVVAASRAVSATLDRYLMFEAWRERAFANARLDLSRDMHDSVLQTLGGLRMQVASLIKDKDLPVAARTRRLESLQSIIAAEQACLRELVTDANLPIGEKIDLASHLAQRAELLSRQWAISCTLTTDPASLWVSPDVAVEVEFLVREAVSNAVQHAESSSVNVVAALRDDALFITLKSDGATVLASETGGSSVEGVKSRSLARRLNALNGRAYADPMERGVLLSMRIPLEAMVDVPTADR